MHHIDFYEFGRIKIDGKYYDRDVIILPEKIICPWLKTRSHYIDAAELLSIEEIFDKKPDVIIMGTGFHGVFMISSDIKEYLSSQNIDFLKEKTTEACEIYNKLSKENKRVVALLHLTC